jgi:pectinesterase
VFLDCKLTADSGATKVFLGRPWRSNAKTIFLRCSMGKHIIPEGWNNWGNAANELTTLYGEYKNSGPGADISNRVKWGHQLTDKEAANYTLAIIFNNEGAALPVNPKWYSEVTMKGFQWPEKK